MLQGVPVTTGLGLVTWNTTTALKSAPARACSRYEATAGAISYCGFLVSIRDPELIRLGQQNAVPLDRRTQW